MKPLYRHGDVLLERAPDLPATATSRPTTILARGEVTGHSHRIETPGTAMILQAGGQFYLNVTAERARIVHDEHAPIELPHGVYRFWHQREYSPEEIRRIVD